MIHNHRTVFFLQLLDRTVSFTFGKKIHYVPWMSLYVFKNGCIVRSCQRHHNLAFRPAIVLIVQ